MHRVVRESGGRFKNSHAYATKTTLMTASYRTAYSIHLTIKDQCLSRRRILGTWCIRRSAFPLVGLASRCERPWERRILGIEARSNPQPIQVQRLCQEGWRLQQEAPRAQVDRNSRRQWSRLKPFRDTSPHNLRCPGLYPSRGTIQRSSGSSTWVLCRGTDPSRRSRR